MTSEQFTEQTLKEQRDKIIKLVGDANIMRAALLLVAEWKRPLGGMGSNDERDHFKGVAQGAINATSG